MSTPSSSTVRRPATIAELADRALVNLWDPSRGLKQWLKTADSFRKSAQQYAEAGDVETAFMQYARAATIILEKLPTHKEYYTLLNGNQRHNLGLNGQAILESLGHLKRNLVDRYELWAAQHPDLVDAPPASQPQPPALRPPSRQVSRDHESSSHDHALDASPSPALVSRPARNDWHHYNQHHEDNSGWLAQEAVRRDRDPERRGRMRSGSIEATMNEHFGRMDLGGPSGGGGSAGGSGNASGAGAGYGSADRKRNDAISAARRAAGAGVGATPSPAQQEPVRYRTPAPPEDHHGPRTPHGEDEWRRREREGILRRQEEAENVARSLRYGGASSAPVQPPYVSASMPAGVAYPSMPSSAMEGAHVRRLPAAETGRQIDPSSFLPLERNSGLSNTMLNAHRSNYPPPVTTTSPAPPDGSIRYPQLMSQHQLTQGYVPSLQSMFNPSSGTHAAPSSSSLLFIPEHPDAQARAHGSGGHGHHQSQHLYPSSVLPPQPSSSHGQGGQYGSWSSSTSRPRYPLPAPPGPSGPTPSPGGPGARSRTPVPPPGHFRTPSEDSLRITRSGGTNHLASTPSPTSPVQSSSSDLKTVLLPKECLPRFLSIAKLNTSQNRETCGLLLGKDRAADADEGGGGGSGRRKRDRYEVTVLLIPRQHSTSDTCTMDEEELVMQFTEERSLITLGWIHTHPSQSCFMSSVDLHTHSGFQRMFPESFAVVCAPKSTPNFGIFRLTDPPGLHTILDCHAKEAFHPHADVPIYTDADKGHVQMKDMPLEIVDLR